jgi:hypothetical protein
MLFCADRFLSGLKKWRRYRLSRRSRQPATAGCVMDCEKSASIFNAVVFGFNDVVSASLFWQEKA